MGFYAFDENGNYRMFDSSSRIVTCCHCRKEYKQTIEEQIPGFRDTSFDICPYCKHENGSSMDVDYYNNEL